MTDDAASLGSHLRAARRRHGLTVAEFAARTGLSRTYLTNSNAMPTA